MTKQSNKIAYPNDTNISDNDYLGGTNGDSIKKETKSFQISDLRDYLLSGLAPEVGGTLKIIEINYEGILTTPHEVANQLDPDVIILQYEIAVFNINGDKYLLKLQNVTIGFTQDDILESDFIALDLVGVNLSGGISTFKGLNSVTGREEHYSLESTGLNISKEVIVDVETGKIVIEQKAQTNLGNGTLIYKGFNSISKLQEFYTISSPDHNISIIDNEIVISNPASSEVLEFIVNSNYTGDEETGSLAQPFKTIQGVLDAYVGVGGTNKTPVNLGAFIRIKKGSGDYTFTGSLSYKGLKLIIEEGARVVSNPSTGDYLMDLDSDASLPIGMTNFTNIEPVDITIDIKEGALLILNKKGFKNRGTNLNTNNRLGKIVRIKGDIFITTEGDVSLPSTRNIFSVNEDNQVGFVNDGNLAHLSIEDCNIQSNTCQIIFAGLNSIIEIANCVMFFGNTSPFNSNTIPIEIEDGSISMDSVRLINGYNNSPTYSLINYVSIKGNSLFKAINSELGRNVDYTFNLKDVGASTLTNITLDRCYSNGTVSEYFKSDLIGGIWDIRLTNCNIIDWNVDYSKVNLIPNSINILELNVVETLNTYTNKELAITAGLFKGCKYIKRTTITTGAFIVGEDYEILNIGDTDFTLIGASANTVGLIFTATGVGGGTTGTAYFDKLDII